MTIYSFFVLGLVAAEAVLSRTKSLSQPSATALHKRAFDEVCTVFTTSTIYQFGGDGGDNTMIPIERLARRQVTEPCVTSVIYTTEVFDFGTPTETVPETTADLSPSPSPDTPTATPTSTRSRPNPTTFTPAPSACYITSTSTITFDENGPNLGGRQAQPTGECETIIVYTIGSPQADPTTTTPAPSACYITSTSTITLNDSEDNVFSTPPGLIERQVQATGECETVIQYTFVSSKARPTATTISASSVVSTTSTFSSSTIVEPTTSTIFSSTIVEPTTSTFPITTSSSPSSSVIAIVTATFSSTFSPISSAFSTTPISVESSSQSSSYPSVGAGYNPLINPNVRVQSTTAPSTPFSFAAPSMSASPAVAPTSDNPNPAANPTSPDQPAQTSDEDGDGKVRAGQRALLPPNVKVASPSSASDSEDQSALTPDNGGNILLQSPVANMVRNVLDNARQMISDATVPLYNTLSSAEDVLDNFENQVRTALQADPFNTALSDLKLQLEAAKGAINAVAAGEVSGNMHVMDSALQDSFASAGSLLSGLTSTVLSYTDTSGHLTSTTAVLLLPTSGIKLLGTRTVALDFTMTVTQTATSTKKNTGSATRMNSLLCLYLAILSYYTIM